jgi:hypothetical protein
VWRDRRGRVRVRADRLLSERLLSRVSERKDRLYVRGRLREQVVPRDPDYAPPWALFAEAYALTPQNYYQGARSESVDDLRRVGDASFSEAETAARRAIELDSNNANGYLALAYVRDSRGEPLLAEELYSGRWRSTPIIRIRCTFTVGFWLTSDD